MNELKSLRTFLLAAKERNFARVARKLNTTPASVTRTISALEEELGIQLFVRTTRQVTLTTNGAIFAARIEPALQMFDEARTDLMHAHKPDQGLLRLNAPMSFGQRVLPQILCGFRDLYPRINFEITLTDKLVDIMDEDFDLSIRISEPPKDKFTIWRKICEIKRMLVAAPGSIYASISHPKDLPIEACLGYESDSHQESWTLTNSGTTTTLYAGQSVSANNGELLAQMAADGAGIALLPSFIVMDYLQTGRLVHILPDWSPPQLWLTLFYPPYQKLPPRIAVFSDYFEKQIPSLLMAIE